jgi:hypothetical protein
MVFSKLERKFVSFKEKPEGIWLTNGQPDQTRLVWSRFVCGNKQSDLSLGNR